MEDTLFLTFKGTEQELIIMIKKYIGVVDTTQEITKPMIQQVLDKMLIPINTEIKNLKNSVPTEKEITNINKKLVLIRKAFTTIKNKLFPKQLETIQKMINESKIIIPSLHYLIIDRERDINYLNYFIEFGAVIDLYAFKYKVFQSDTSKITENGLIISAQDLDGEEALGDSINHTPLPIKSNSDNNRMYIHNNSAYTIKINSWINNENLKFSVVKNEPQGTWTDIVRKATTRRLRILRLFKRKVK